MQFYGIANGQANETAVHDILLLTALCNEGKQVIEPGDNLLFAVRLMVGDLYYLIPSLHYLLTKDPNMMTTAFCRWKYFDANRKFIPKNHGSRFE